MLMNIVCLFVSVVAVSAVNDTQGDTRQTVRSVAAQPAQNVSGDLDAALRDIMTWAGSVTPESVTAARAVGSVKTIRECAVSGDRELVVPLGMLAEACSEGSMRLLALEALDAQRRLGLPTEGFLELAADHARRPFLAAYAALVAGQSLDAAALARLEQLAVEATKHNSTPSTLFAWAEGRTKSAIAFRSKLRSLDLESSVSELSQAAIGGYNPWFEAEPRIEPSLDRADPITVFARGELARLSVERPNEMAQLLRKSPMAGMVDKLRLPSQAREEMLDKYRDWVSAFLAPAALADYRVLRPVNPK